MSESHDSVEQALVDLEEQGVGLLSGIRSYLRPQVNWNAMLDPEVVAGLAPEFLDLLGYRKGLVDLLGTMRPAGVQ